MKSFYEIWLKQIHTKEELKERLLKRSKNLKSGEHSQFFINHKPYLLINENGRFLIKKQKV